MRWPIGTWLSLIAIYSRGHSLHGNSFACLAHRTGGLVAEPLPAVTPTHPHEVGKRADPTICSACCLRSTGTFSQPLVQLPVYTAVFGTFTDLTQAYQIWQRCIPSRGFIRPHKMHCPSIIVCCVFDVV